MGFFDRIRENDRKLRESNRKELARVDAKLAPYTKRKLNITADDDTVPAVSRQVHITIDPLPPRKSKPLSTPLRASKAPSAAEVANRSARIDAELARNRRDAQKTSAPASAPKQEVVMGTSPAPKAARPGLVKPVPQATRTVSTPPSAPKLKPRNYSTEAADKLKLGEDNAVTKRLRERALMSQEERDKPFGEDNEVLKKLRGLGYNFAKGGKINGVARKGKTKGRFI